MKPNIVCVSLLQKSFPQTSKCPKNQRQTVRGRLKKIHAISSNHSPHFEGSSRFKKTFYAGSLNFFGRSDINVVTM